MASNTREQYFEGVIQRMNTADKNSQLALRRPGALSLPATATNYDIESAVSNMPGTLISRPVDGSKPKASVWPARVLLAYLARMVNTEQGSAWPSQASISEFLDMNKETLRSAVRCLESAGLLIVVPGFAKGQSTRYYLPFHAKSYEAFRLKREQLTLALSNIRLGAEPVAANDDTSSTPF